VAAHVWNSAGGLLKTSNRYCHPGKAGGSLAYARLVRQFIRLKAELANNYQRWYCYFASNTPNAALNQTEESGSFPMFCRLAVKRGGFEVSDSIHQVVAMGR
jgi:hypothetical protein